MNIVLVHGILGFRQKLGFDYFRGIPQRLRDKGITVLAAELDRTEGIEFRGNQLCEQINAAFASGQLHPKEPTHIIAHSMGGLDSRYILSPASGKKIDGDVLSLTTLGTPHLGSPIADFVQSVSALNPLHAPAEAALAAVGISFNGVRDLRTDACKRFSAKYTNNSKVKYFSAAGKGRGGILKTAGCFVALYTYLSMQTGKENDGLVTADSAAWGTFDTDLWPGDHVEMVGYNMDNLISEPSFPYLEKYDRIVATISALH